MDQPSDRRFAVACLVAVGVPVRAEFFQGYGVLLVVLPALVLGMLASVHGYPSVP